MSGYYAKNPHDAFGIDLNAIEAEESADRAKDEAVRYFADATKDQLQTYTNRIVEIGPYYGSPYWERERDFAKRRYAETTKDACELMERTVSCLIETGEVSESLSFEWDALMVKPRVIRVGDHDAEVAA